MAPPLDGRGADRRAARRGRGPRRRGLAPRPAGRPGHPAEGQRAVVVLRYFDDLTEAVVGAAAAVALVATLGSALTPADRSAPADRQAATTPAAPDPYGTDPCPASLSLQAKVTAVDPAAVRSVRWCAYDGGRTQAVPLDALVTGLSSVADRLEALPTADPGRCAATDAIMPSTALVLTDEAGVDHAFPVGICSDVALGKRVVASEQAQAVALAALDAQRTRLGSSEGVTAPWASRLCTTEASDTPLDPTRDRVVAGAVCFVETDHPRRVRQAPMPAATLTRVQAAWVKATLLPPDTAFCLIGHTRWYAVLTSAGDVFTLYDDCGTVPVFASPDQIWDVPITID